MAPLAEGGSSSSAAEAPAQEEQPDDFPSNIDGDGQPEQPETSEQPRSLESERQDVEMVPAVDTQPFLRPAGILSTGLTAASSQAEMKARLKELYAPVWGDRHTLWKRLIVEEEKARRKRTAMTQPEQEVQRRKDGQNLVRPKILSFPEMPSQREIDEHNATHIPYAPWCSICIAAKGRISQIT